MKTQNNLSADIQRAGTAVLGSASRLFHIGCGIARNLRARTGKSAVLTAGIFALASAAPSPAAVITWTGAGANNSFFNRDNWDFGGYAGSFASGTAISADIVINDANVSLPGDLWIGTGFGLTATNTVFNSSGNGQGVFRSAGSSSGESTNKAQYNLINSSVYLEHIGTNSIFNLEGGSLLTIDSAASDGINTYSVVRLGAASSISFLNGSGGTGSGVGVKQMATRIVSAETGVSFFADYYGGGDFSLINFNDPDLAGSGPQLAFRLTGSDSTPFGTTDEISGGTPNSAFTITAIPEPSTVFLALSGLAFLAIWKRRYLQTR